jgi:hypothetical protein
LIVGQPKLTWVFLNSLKTLNSFVFDRVILFFRERGPKSDTAFHTFWTGSCANRGRVSYLPSFWCQPLSGKDFRNFGNPPDRGCLKGGPAGQVVEYSRDENGSVNHPTDFILNYP